MDTYDDLVTLAQQLAEDTSSEFLTYLPTAIQLAEDRLFRIMDINFSKEGILTTSNNQRDVTKPSDYRVTHDVYIEISGERQRLINKTEDFIKDYWPSLSETSVPKYYADKDLLTWMLAPTPNGVYNLYVEYEGPPTPLSPSNQTNVFIDMYPDVLTYAVMSNVCEWMKDDERKGVWEEKLAEALASTNNEGERQRHDDNTNVNNPIGGKNTKVKNGV